MNENDWVYTEKVQDHFMNPRNILEDINEYDFDGKGMTGNLQCGDEMLFVIKVDQDKNVITDCKWKTFGCASAIASTSKLSEMAIGMSPEEAYDLGPNQIIKALDGLPDRKIHCSVLGDKALRAAIDDYWKRNGMEDKIPKDKKKVVCNCMNVTNHDIEEAVLHGARDFEELQEHTKLGTVCGECKPEATRMLEEYIEKHFSND